MRIVKLAGVFRTLPKHAKGLIDDTGQVAEYASRTGRNRAIHQNHQPPLHNE
jgi:hypothetical protein